MKVLSILLAMASIAFAADSSGTRAALQPANERKAAPELALQDSSGQAMELTEYRGNVVLLDFWATWCTGCKKEIPWFSQFQKMYGAQGFAVVGVSMDDGGWKVLKRFWLRTTYRTEWYSGMIRQRSSSVSKACRIHSLLIETER